MTWAAADQSGAPLSWASARPPPRSSAEDRGEFEMRCPHELIDRRQVLEAVAAAEQHGGVASEGGRVAGDCDDRGYRRGRERLHLPGGAGARRIEHRGGIAGERLRRKRVAREVAALDGDHRLVGGGAGERGGGARIALDGVDRTTTGQGKGESTEPGEQIE